MSIISHERKFIFIKTRKTASTTLEIALSRDCGPRDVITPIAADDERIRTELGYRGAQNYRDPLWTYRRSDWYRLVKKRKCKGYRDHMSASDLRRRVGDQVWSTYFTFCFERNPWDKAISSYYWLQRNKQEKRSLDQHILSGAYLHYRTWDLYTANDVLLVDQVFRYEELSESAVVIARRLKLPAPLYLPLTKARHRTDRRPYWEVLSDAAAEHIADHCAPEISLMGYRYGS